MPRLWSDTIEGHRREVRDGILEATVGLVADHGIFSVSMSQIAERAGIGRATLYKYFPDVESILVAWHERKIASHLDQLGAARDHADDPGGRLRAVLEAYAQIQWQRVQHHDEAHGRDLSAFLHRDEHVAEARGRVHEMIRDLIIEAVKAGDVRSDVAPHELATYCLHALTAASSLPSKAAVSRLTSVVLTGLRPHS